MTFSQVERLVGPLPLEARVSESWWTSGAAAQAIAAGGWRIQSVDMANERISLGRSETAPIGASVGPVSGGMVSVGNLPDESAVMATDAANAQTAAKRTSRFQSYIAGLNVPLVVVLLFLCVVLGAIGFGLRPGTDRPPPVPNDRIQLNVYEQASQNGPKIAPSKLNVDEILMRQAPGVVELQIDLFGSFAQNGQVTWRLLTGISQSQPRACPDLTHYLGANGNPLTFTNGGVSIDGRFATSAVMSNFEGRPSSRTAANVLGLEGHPPAVTPAKMQGLGEVNLCWTHGAPLAFSGEYASASIPTVSVGTLTTSAVRYEVTRSLYFVNKTQSAQPVTAQYSLQAGTLPSSTDPIGWHWSADNGAPIQLVALNIPESQHETYLGFLSGVLFGVAGGALVTLFQEVLDPLRGRRKTRRSEEKAS
jgi:hypothetical protein